MNLHAPQSVEAATELREIAAVPLQIISPRESVPIVSVVQDTLVGANRFTRPNVLFTKKEAMNLLVHAKRWDGKLPEPVTTDPQPMWSGQQLLSALLPPVSMEVPNSSYGEEDKKNPKSQNLVKIYKGQIYQGILDKSTFSKHLLQVIYNDYGPDMTVDFLDSLQAMIANFLMNSGFSVGISDLIADEGTNAEIEVALQKLTKTVEDQILQLHSGLFENSSGRSNQEEFEGKAMSVLNKAVGEAGKIGLKTLADTNRMTNMVKAGSKGSDVNVSQMIGTLGQTAIEGKRVPNGFQHRTLPHFKRFDDSAQARGFIASSYIKGLQPDEFFFHAMSGREGLIDTAVKTADTGYLQRQIRVALEDLITQHDGSVRDATGNLLQLAYGEDGANATKLEGQAINLAGMSDAEIAQEFVAEGASGAEQYIADLKVDRKALVEGVFQGRPAKSARYPVHLERTIVSVKHAMNLSEETASVTATEVLEAHTKIFERTHAHNRLWGALVRYHLSPTKLRKYGFTRVALDALVEQIVLKHWKSWVEPGQPVGVIAAQSIGEPCTQMTLNSVDWHTEILIAKDGVIQAPRIGEFIDNYISAVDPTKIQRFENDQLYVALEDGHDWQAVSCDASGKMMWTKLEAITKHPVVNADGTNTILEVKTESGRIVRATKGKSFLVYTDGKFVATDGSDLKIGDALPIANHLALGDVKAVGELDLKSVLPADEWLYGDEIVKALAAMRAADAEGVRHWYKNGTEFTVPYARSDAFRDAFANGHNSRAAEFKPDCVYPKSTRSCVSHIPSKIALNREFGYFCGAYLAEGCSSTTQIQITNNDDLYLEPIRALLDSWSVGHHTVAAEKHGEKSGIIDHTQSLVIHSTLLTTLFRSMFGVLSHGKTFPVWMYAAPDAFLHGLVDGYISGDGSVKADNTIVFSSASEDLITRIVAVLARYGIFATRSSRMPELGKFDTVHMQHIAYIPQMYARRFAKQFKLTIAEKQMRLDAMADGESRCKYGEVEDVVLDKVKSISEILPYGGRMYDVTVAETRNFLGHNLVGFRDTFHLAGVAAKSNMTRGVPRMKELLKATKNPKAIELQIPLRRDLRNKKEEARRVAQELEFTLLQDIVTTARIYYDPNDNATLIKDDQDWLAYMAAFSMVGRTGAAAGGAAGGISVGDALAGGVGAAEQQVEQTSSQSPWILRFELDRERMFAKNITMDDIAFILRSKFSSDLSVIYTDYNATRLVFRARLNPREGTSSIDDLNALKVLQNKVLSATAVRGIPGLRSVNYQKVSDVYEYNAEEGRYKAVDQYMLISDGSNFLDVLTHPDVDPTRVVSSNIHDMMENLGIEATRATLFKEITSLFADSGTGVNYRHVSVLIDKMCHKGKVMSVDRYGINKNDIGPLAKMSFEQTEDIALRAAMFGERDPCLGVSAKVMLGSPIKAGTAFSELLFDESAAIALAASTPEQRPALAAGPGTYSEEELGAMIYGEEESGECSVAEIRMHVPMPAGPMESVEEEDLEDVEISIVA
jgi:DNA-directed RNA polymerase beta' subunit